MFRITCVDNGATVGPRERAHQPARVNNLTIFG